MRTTQRDPSLAHQVVIYLEDGHQTAVTCNCRNRVSAPSMGASNSPEATARLYNDPLNHYTLHGYPSFRDEDKLNFTRSSHGERSQGI